jgi:hypothetical protein
MDVLRVWSPVRDLQLIIAEVGSDFSYGSARAPKIASPLKPKLGLGGTSRRWGIDRRRVIRSRHRGRILSVRPELQQAAADYRQGAT